MLHTPTSQPLFIQHKSAAELLSKEAAAIARMPDDDKRWPAQVLSEIHKQLPFVSKYDVDIEMTRVEPEAGYALGYAILRNKTGRQRAEEQLGKPTNKLRVPVIVADRMLQPFHVFEIGGKVYPLTQERVESAMMNPAMFDGAADPPGTRSLLDQIYPPFQHRQGYGMMSGDRATQGVSKLSSAPDKVADWRERAAEAGLGALSGAVVGGAAGGAANPENRKKGLLRGAVKGALVGGAAMPLALHGATKLPDLAHLAKSKGHHRLGNAIGEMTIPTLVAGTSAPAALAAAYRKKQEKTASGELGPLREFLRQKELEKQAFTVPLANASKATGRFFSGLAGGARNVSQRIGANLVSRVNPLRGVANTAREGFQVAHGAAQPGAMSNFLERKAFDRAAAARDASLTTYNTQQAQAARDQVMAARTPPVGAPQAPSPTPPPVQGKNLLPYVVGAGGVLGGAYLLNKGTDTISQY